MTFRLWALLFAAVLSAPAQATIISGSLAFTATPFMEPGAPVDPVTGMVTFSFDNAASFANVTTGFSVTGLNIPGTLGPGMTYFKSDDILVIGDLLNGAASVTGGSNDWYLEIDHISKSLTSYNYVVVYLDSGVGEQNFYLQFARA